MPNYTVAQMADVSGLTPHTLRYYEKESLILDVPRDNSGRRCYSEYHLSAVKFITVLRATGMSISTIKQYIDLYRQGDHTAQTRMALLEDHERDVVQHLHETQNSLELIRKKIRFYKGDIGLSAETKP